MEQHRAQPGFERFHAREIRRERCLRVPQTLDVGNEAAPLHSKAKIGGRLLVPTLHGGFCGQPVKTIVDLYRLEIPNIPGQVLGRRKISRVADQ